MLSILNERQHFRQQAEEESSTEGKVTTGLRSISIPITAPSQDKAGTDDHCRMKISFAQCCG